MQLDTATAFERLKRRVVFDPSGCWNWQGSMTSDFYGRIRVGDKVMATHRLAYTVAHGSIPRGKVVRHKCDNPRCCNPGHLVIGDHEDNAQDMVDRGRHELRRRQLSPEEIGRLVSMRAAGATKREIAVDLKANWYIVSKAIDRAGVDGVKRPGRPKGSRNLHARVSDDRKQQMRTLYATGQFTQQQLAEQFGCDQTYVSLIVRGLK